MTDERLAELRQDLEATSIRQVELKRQREDAHAAITRMAAEVQRINAARKELDIPYKDATERVADLTAQIVAEDRRRAEVAEAQRKADKASKEAAEAVAAAADAAAG